MSSSNLSRIRPISSIKRKPYSVLKATLAVTHQKGTSEFQGAYTFDGALEAIRTPDPFLRREVLYPAELRARICGLSARLLYNKAIKD